MSHISPCYEYRLKKEGETSEEFGLRVANELETEILRVGEKNVAAFVAEPVVGATLGCVAAVKGYYKRIKEICEKYGVLLILDEVMCGMGRTGTLFACEQEGITADIITIAKGLGAGYQPIGAFLLSKKIYDAIEKGSGFFQHGHTYIGHATACAAALAVQKVIEKQGLLANVQQKGDALKAALQNRFKGYANIGDIRGRGLFIGVELVKDLVTKEPFDPSLKINAQIKKTAMEKGLMCYAMGGTVDGKNGDHVMLAPPFIMEDAHVSEVVDILGKSIDEVLAKHIRAAA
jgi:adenosylmethionine-8-amino-7-oxononanoate aminotransferase